MKKVITFLFYVILIYSCNSNNVVPLSKYNGWKVVQKDGAYRKSDDFGIIYRVCIEKQQKVKTIWTTQYDYDNAELGKEINQ